MPTESIQPERSRTAIVPQIKHIITSSDFLSNTKKTNRHEIYRLVFIFDSGGGDRTHDLTGMNRTLSPAELRRQNKPTKNILQQVFICVNRICKIL